MDFNITWTPEGVASYGADNPLVVELGDQIIFLCPLDGPYKYSNVWIHKHQEQYDQCDCTAVPTESCDVNVFRNGICAALGNLKIKINDPEGTLMSVFNYVPGQRYYFASHASEQSAGGAFAEQSSGGQCLQGLRMVFEVQALPTSAPSPEEVDGSTTTRGASDNDGSTTTESDFTLTSIGDSPTSVVTSYTVSFNQSFVNSTEPATEQPKKLRDWHIYLIVVLGVLLVSIILVAVILTLVIVLRRRKAAAKVNPEENGEGLELKSDLESKPDVENDTGTKLERKPRSDSKVSGTELDGKLKADSSVNGTEPTTNAGTEKETAHYPTENFEDPLDMI